MRRRPILSCLNCRNRRVRCDKARPVCRRCAIANLGCTYANDQYEATGSQRGTQPDSSPVMAAQHPPSGETSTQNEDAPDALSSGQPSPLAESGLLLTEGEGRSHYLGPTFWGSAILSSSQIEDRQSSFLRRLPQWAQQVRNDGSTWRRPIDASPELPDFTGMCTLCGAPFSLDCCLAMLPSKSVCNRLCSAFFTNVYPLIPIMHLPSFKADHDAFWADLQQSSKHKFTVGQFQRRKPDFVSLIFSIMFAGLSTLPTSEASSIVGSKTKYVAEGLYFATIKSATLVGFPRRPSLYSLSSYIIAEMQLLREEDFPDPPTHISTSFRVALSMGLHRDSTKFAFPEAETRRRIWWYIIHLDVMMSASSGLSPLFIDEKMANAVKICRSDNGPEGTEFNISQGDVRYIVARYRYAISKALRSIIREQFEGKLQRTEELKNAASDLGGLANSIFAINARLLPDSLEGAIRPPSVDATGRRESVAVSRILDHNWTLSARISDQLTDTFCSWSAMLLHLMLHKAYCVLYHPIMRRSPDAIAASTRTNAVKHAQAFMLLFITICTDRRSSQYYWMYPGIYQPLQPLSLLLSDLLRYPHSDEALSSRGLIDAVFELYQVDHGIVSRNDSASRALSECGKGSWLMLIRARTKALEAVGHDPHVLLPHRPAPDEMCICGNPIRVNNTEPPPARGTSPGSSSSIFEPHRQTVVDETIPEDPGIATFNWDEFDALLGDGTGFLA